MTAFDYLDIHHWFGLSYSSYLVIPRSVMEAMPTEWQNRMLALMSEVEETFDLSDAPESYTVNARKGNRFISDPYRNYRRPPKMRRR